MYKSIVFIAIHAKKKAGAHREGSWTRSLRLTPLRSSARFRKQLSLTGTTNGEDISSEHMKLKALTVKFSEQKGDLL